VVNIQRMVESRGGVQQVCAYKNNSDDTRQSWGYIYREWQSGDSVVVTHTHIYIYSIALPEGLEFKGRGAFEL
jgi:DNA gyrase inhibitor GyrI